ncbi:retinol dehydrogenase 8-like [Xenia sp. Carnegie-2017]|uniref:retinol dehydrogenase 8-like n=1 Tax=Xenia sp. Carnegie-2017 TaxID=2897299 RepID=UPI001F03F21D|nr:retinol dehydrogenase 8-like [Xenia sp. Carnegie-2017]
MSKEIVLITGTSSGVGLSTAELLAKQTSTKFKVYASMRNTSKKDAFLEKTAGCSNIVVIELDVCSEDSVNAAVTQILKKEGKIDVLVNNAGTTLPSAIESHPWESIENIYNTNVFGVLRMIRAVVPSMKKNKKGRIINISSILGLCAMPFVSVYSSTKYAVEGITDSLAAELVSFNIQMIAVEPGPVLTPLLINSFLDPDQLSNDDETKALIQKVYSNVGKQMPSSSHQTTDECAEYIIKAIMDENPNPRYLTYKDFEEICRAKYCDLTGKIPFEISKKLLE